MSMIPKAGPSKNNKYVPKSPVPMSKRRGSLTNPSSSTSEANSFFTKAMMYQACALLLSDADYVSPPTIEKQDKDKDGSSLPRKQPTSASSLSTNTATATAITTGKAAPSQSQFQRPPVSDKARLFALFRRCQNVTNLMSNSSLTKKQLSMPSLSSSNPSSSSAPPTPTMQNNPLYKSQPFQQHPSLRAPSSQYIPGPMSRVKNNNMIPPYSSHKASSNTMMPPPMPTLPRFSKLNRSTSNNSGDGSISSSNDKVIAKGNLTQPPAKRKKYNDNKPNASSSKNKRGEEQDVDSSQNVPLAALNFLAALNSKTPQTRGSVSSRTQSQTSTDPSAGITSAPEPAKGKKLSAGNVNTNKKPHSPSPPPLPSKTSSPLAQKKHKQKQNTHQTTQSSQPPKRRSTRNQPTPPSSESASQSSASSPSPSPSPSPPNSPQSSKRTSSRKKNTSVSTPTRSLRSRQKTDENLLRTNEDSKIFDVGQDVYVKVDGTWFEAIVRDIVFPVHDEIISPDDDNKSKNTEAQDESSNANVKSTRSSQRIRKGKTESNAASDATNRRRTRKMNDSAATSSTLNVTYVVEFGDGEVMSNVPFSQIVDADEEE